MLVTGDVAVNAYPLRTASWVAVINGNGSGSSGSRYAFEWRVELRSGLRGHSDPIRGKLDACGTEMVKRIARLASASSFSMVQSGGSDKVGMRKSSPRASRWGGSARTVNVSPGTISLRSAMASRRNPAIRIRAVFIFSRLRRTLWTREAIGAGSCEERDGTGIWSSFLPATMRESAEAL